MHATSIIRIARVRPDGSQDWFIGVRPYHSQRRKIDAAQRGASFHAVIDAAVKFAVAEHARDGAALEKATKKMDALGLTMLATELRAFVAE